MLSHAALLWPLRPAPKNVAAGRGGGNKPIFLIILFSLSNAPIFALGGVVVVEKIGRPRPCCIC